jgi:methyltransferase (TIGR00027 family)
MKIDRASDTAVLIARSLLLLDATPPLRGLLPPESARLTRILLDGISRAGWFEFCLRHRFTRSLLFGAERCFLPGIFLHYHVRKLQLREFVANAHAAGCRQLVILGAGLDTLAWRHALETDSQCFELDHPATQEIKRSALQHEDRKPILIAADFTRDSPSALLRKQASFNPNARVVIVAEGLLMYFSPQRVRDLIQDLSTIAAPGSRFAFTFMEARAGKPLAFHNARSAVNFWLRARQEPFRWGIDRSQVEPFVAEHGWNLVSLSSPDALRAQYLTPFELADAPLAIGESIAFANKPSLTST